MSGRPRVRGRQSHITDAAAYRQYEKGFFPLLQKYGGEFITYDDAAFTLEGTSPRTGRVILFKFPSEAQARSWYADPTTGAERAPPRRHLIGFPDDRARPAAALTIPTLTHTFTRKDGP